MWLYKDTKKFYIKTNKFYRRHALKNTFGFIFMRFAYIPTNEKYLGKKVLFFNKTLPPLKG